MLSARMQSLRCVYSPATALRRVFLPHLDAAVARPAAPFPSTYLSPRLFSTTSARPKLFGRKKKEKPPERKAVSRFPTDNAIPYKWVVVAQPDGRLGERQRTADVLRQLDRSKYTLAMVAPPVEPKPDEESLDAESMKLEELAPVCRVIDKHAHAKLEEDKEKEWRRKQKNLKELEINWAIDSHDLGHRLERFLEFLEKGKRVEVTLARKRKSRPATPAEASRLVERILEAATVVPAKMVKQEGQFPKMMMLAFEQTKQERQIMEQKKTSARERYEDLLESQREEKLRQEEED